jgi:hypothetical protein
MFKMTVAAFPPGVTALGEKLQVANAGNPAQLSWIALLNGPPSGLRVKV